jgi:hypothetical protein
MKKQIVSMLAIAGLSVGAYAGGCANLTCDQVSIEEIVATAWGSTTVATSGTETSLSCTPFANKFLYIAPGAAGANAMYSALLTAKTTGKKVRINLVSDSDGHCQISYINIK